MNVFGHIHCERGKKMGRRKKAGETRGREVMHLSKLSKALKAK